MGGFPKPLANNKKAGFNLQGFYWFKTNKYTFRIMDSDGRADKEVGLWDAAFLGVSEAK
jgi:hypothetical protein